LFDEANLKQVTILRQGFSIGKRNYPTKAGKKPVKNPDMGELRFLSGETI